MIKAGYVGVRRVITLKDARMGRHILSINARGELVGFIKIGKIIRARVRDWQSGGQGFKSPQLLHLFHSMSPEKLGIFPHTSTPKTLGN